VVVFNYTGDRLNFGLAVEQARASGLKVSLKSHMRAFFASFFFIVAFLSGVLQQLHSNIFVVFARFAGLQQAPCCPLFRLCACLKGLGIG
jgi:membrane protein YqaA with SNARE-associated domain